MRYFVGYERFWVVLEDAILVAAAVHDFCFSHKIIMFLQERLLTL